MGENHFETDQSQAKPLLGIDVTGISKTMSAELELELTQTQMAQKPMLPAEV
jgi:hypothetical protein